MPVDRRDLLEILNFNNRVADECLLVAEHMMVPVAPLPAALADGFCTATRQCVAVVQQTVCVMDEMDEMVETGFGGREATLVSGMLDEVGAARKRADNAIQNLFRALFTQGEALSPIAVVFWSRILDELTEVTRTAGRASNRVRLLLAH
jgi:predicted phosphate transport protein (TIGR00153 family)